MMTSPGALLRRGALLLVISSLLPTDAAYRKCNEPCPAGKQCYMRLVQIAGWRALDGVPVCLDPTALPSQRSEPTTLHKPTKTSQEVKGTKQPKTTQGTQSTQPAELTNQLAQSTPQVAEPQLVQSKPQLAQPQLTKPGRRAVQRTPQVSQRRHQLAKVVPHLAELLKQLAQSASHRAQSTSQQAQSAPQQAQSAPQQAQSAPQQAQSAPQQAQSAPQKAPPTTAPSVAGEAPPSCAGLTCGGGDVCYLEHPDCLHKKICHPVPICDTDLCSRVKCHPGNTCIIILRPDSAPNCDTFPYCRYRTKCVPTATPKGSFCPSPQIVTESTKGESTCKYDTDCPSSLLCCPGLASGQKHCSAAAFPALCGASSCPGGVCTVQNGRQVCRQRTACRPGTYACLSGVQAYCSQAGNIVRTKLACPVTPAGVTTTHP